MKFIDYLQEQHATDYRGTDDDMPNSFDNWLADIDIEDLIEFGEQYGKYLLKNK